MNLEIPDDTCPICFEPIEPGDADVVSVSRQMVHYRCYLEWVPVTKTR